MSVPRRPEAEALDTEPKFRTYLDEIAEILLDALESAERDEQAKKSNEAA